jgi:hypothetical protein
VRTNWVFLLAAKDFGQFPAAMLYNDSLSVLFRCGFSQGGVQCFQIVRMRGVGVRRVTRVKLRVEVDCGIE